MGRKNNRTTRLIPVSAEVVRIADQAARLADDATIVKLAATVRHSRRIKRRTFEAIAAYAS